MICATSKQQLLHFCKNRSDCIFKFSSPVAAQQTISSLRPTVISTLNLLSQFIPASFLESHCVLDPC
jgi:hypothetical protein